MPSRMKPGAAIAVIACVICWSGLAQQASDLPSFEVATVKPSKGFRTPEGYSYSDVAIKGPGRLRAVNANLDECIRWAYSLEEYQVSGPEWLKSNSITFDIEAVGPAQTPAGQMRLMFRRLLSERFGLVLHREVKTMAGYALVVHKGGHKLQKSAASGPAGIWSGGGRMTTDATTMARLASALSRELHRPVVDQTNFTGQFAVALEYAPLSSSDSPRPSIFTALQELGLQLQPTKAGVEIMVIDRAEKIPIAN